MEKTLDTSIQYLKGVGTKKAEIFNKIGINTIEDLLYYFPRRYEDRAKFTQIKDLLEGSVQTIKVEILAKGQRQSWRNRRFNIFEAAAADATGKIFCVWFNQPYLKNYLKVGSTLVLYGRVERYGSRLQMSSPEFEIISQDNDETAQGAHEQAESLNIGRIVPVYSLPQGLTQRAFRRFVKSVLAEFLPKVFDSLPFNLRQRHNFLNLAKSLLEIHFPSDFILQKQAYERLSFEEFFLFQLLLALRKSRKQAKKGIAHKIEGSVVKDFIKALPFKLTQAQEAVIREISVDMAKPAPMQRLLQGDVGSGKTVVAIVASLIAIQGGYQVAFMVPTEVLAKQHFEKIRAQFIRNKSTLRLVSLAQGKLFDCTQGRQESKEQEDVGQVRVGLLVSGLNKEEKKKVYQRIEEGRIDLIIGTHALLQEYVKFRNLGLVVIDEQHKFGVGQRALLPQKGFNPDVLIMTATPIPRTLAITLYGDLDVSVMKESPVGRLPIKTLHFGIKEQEKAYAIAKGQLILGHQVYIVYPVIEESYALDILGAKKMYERLKNNEFKEFRIGLIHGKLKQSQQDEVMLKFKNKELDVLVSTTVLEVGIDVPEATCIVIEHSQRFGLAQQHQLRGRVGRGPYESFCILVSDAVTEDAKARIAAMMKYSDGFSIAEEDLKIRGPGEFFGSRQHGLSELKIANPLTQMQLLKKAREEAVTLIKEDYLLDLRQNSVLKEKLLHRFPEYEKLVVGV